MVSGLLLFGLPALLLDPFTADLPTVLRASLLTLVPAAVLVIANSRPSARSDFFAVLGAGVAGVAGAFLLLPADPELLVRRPAAAGCMGATVISIAFGSYLGHSVPGHPPLRWRLLLMVGPSLLLAGAPGVLHAGTFGMPGLLDLPKALWEGVEMVLLVWLVREVDPVALSARYLLIPFLTAVEGFVYLRPGAGWRLALGAGLLVYGAVRLLRRTDPGEEPSMSLL
ncbi:MAG: hypothetical protein NVSMB3_11520 [Acidobacteriaceae bacterium]